VNLAIVINYCTADYRFLHLCTQAALRCTPQVVVVVSDHFFDGTQENQELLKQSYQEIPRCLFVEFAYNPKAPYGPYCPYIVEDEEWAHYWHSTGRYVGFHFLEKATTHVLFLDVDEILDSERFLHWLSCLDPTVDAVRLSGYYYFRKPCFRALSHLPTSLLLKKDALTSPEVLLNIFERKGVFEAITGKKIWNEKGKDGNPLLHHYSWVRPKEELLLKVARWGHRRERDWAALIDHEFSQEFRGQDTIYGMHYEIVEACHNPLVDVAQNRSTEVNNVIRASPQEVMRRGVALSLG